MGAAIGGVLALWDLVKPVAKGALGFVNQQQREAAIRRFIANEAGPLRQKVEKLAEFSKRRGDYERAFAANEFSQAMKDGLSDGTLSDEERNKALTAAEAYDEVRKQDASGAYTQVAESITRLENVTKGKYNREDLAAAIGSLGKSIGSLNAVRENVTALEKGGDKHNALKDALDKIRGKAPTTATGGS